MISKLRILFLFIGALALIFAGVGVQTANAAPTDLIISEYIEGSSFNKSVEIFNGTGASVDLGAGQYRLELYTNGSSTVSQFINLTGTIADGDVLVISHASANTSILAVTDITNSTVINFNGDDAVVLRKGGAGGTVVDSIGQVGVDPGTNWVVGSGATSEFTLVRQSTVCIGDTDPSNIYVSSEWDINPQNTSSFLGSHSVSCTPTDTAPTVTSTTPTNGASGVLIGSTISIDFSEAVDISASGVTVECPSGNPITFTPALPVTNVDPFVLIPSASLPYNTLCTITVLAANVTDRDGTANAMASNYNFTFTTEAAPIVTRIHDVQGNGSATPIPGATVTVEAIVVGDYQGAGVNGLSGIFIQEEDADIDADPATSEGIFVYCNTCPTAVNVGDLVRVTGTVSESFNMTQISATTAGSVSVLSTGNTSPTASSIDLPVVGDINTFYERLEGMLVTFSDVLTVSEYFELARFGQIELYEGGRPYQFTHTNAPSVAGYTAHLDNLARRRIVLDDINDTQNAPLPAGVFYYPQPGGFGTGTQGVNYFRGGDTVSNLTGVLQYSFSEWRIRPTNTITFTPVNTRPVTPPTVTGDVIVASFNVLNYFTTIDTTTSSSTGPCGPSATLDCRGADSANELDQQTDKLVAALRGIDADIFGFMEMENISNSTTLAYLVNELNTAIGTTTYDYVNTGTVGTDAITTAIIYKPAIVQPVGGFLTDSDAIHDRPPLAVLFEVVEVGNPSFGEQFYVVVNHFKSKGSSAGLPGDADAGDGQSQSNATRVAQATRLLTWIGTTLTADPDVLIIGDLNSYRLEDPITTLEAGGFTNLVDTFGGANAYSYVFDGQLGYLDHALANASLLPYVTGTAEWHINADEVPVFDYNNYIDDGAGEQSFEAKPTGNNLYEANAFRTSDHDPVIIGLAFPQPAPIVTSAIEIVGSGSVASTNPAAPAQLTSTVSSVAVTFSTAVENGNPANPDHADNPANYILLAEGSVAGFQTTGTNACVTGVNAGDTAITFTVAYNAGTNTATLTVTGASPFPPLTVGKYSLIVCGSTSIVSAGANIPLNNGADVQYFFDITATTNNGGGNTNTGGTTTTVLTQEQIESGAVQSLPATGETPVWADTMRNSIVIGIIALFTLGLGFIILRRRTAR